VGWQQLRRADSAGWLTAAALGGAGGRRLACVELARSQVMTSVEVAGDDFR